MRFQRRKALLLKSNSAGVTWNRIAFLPETVPSISCINTCMQLLLLITQVARVDGVESRSSQAGWVAPPIGPIVYHWLRLPRSLTCFRRPATTTMLPRRGKASNFSFLGVHRILPFANTRWDIARPAIIQLHSLSKPRVFPRRVIVFLVKRSQG
jgi:hypothetical protein